MREDEGKARESSVVDCHSHAVATVACSHELHEPLRKQTQPLGKHSLTLTRNDTTILTIITSA